MTVAGANAGRRRRGGGRPFVPGSRCSSPVTAGFAVAAVSLAAYLTMRMELFHELDSSLVSRAQRVAALQQQIPETLQTTPSLSLLASEIDLCLVSAPLQQVECTTSGLTRAIQAGPELSVASGDQAQSLRTLRIGSTSYRVVAVPVGSDAALVLARSTRDTQTTLNDLGLVLFVVGAARHSRRGRCRPAGRPRRFATGGTPDPRGRTRWSNGRPHADRHRERRRTRPPCHQLQRHAGRRCEFAAAAAATCRRCRSRTPYAVDQPPYQPRAARSKRCCG